MISLRYGANTTTGEPLRLTPAASLDTLRDLALQPLDHAGGIALQEPFQKELGNIERGLRRKLVSTGRVAVPLRCDPSAVITQEASAASIAEPDGSILFPDLLVTTTRTSARPATPTA